MKRLIALMLSLLMVFAFVACDSEDDDDDDDSEKPLTAEDVMENLDEAGYYLELIKDEKTLSYEITAICDGFYPEGNLTAIVEAGNFETDDFVRVYFFEKKADAKSLNELFEEYEAGGEKTGEYKQQDNIFITATSEQAINDALGKKSGSSSGGIGGIGGGAIGGGAIGGGSTDKALTLEQMMANLEKAGFTCEITRETGESYVVRSLAATKASNPSAMVAIGECASAKDAQAEYEAMQKDDDAAMLQLFKCEVYDRYVILATSQEYIEYAKGEKTGSTGGNSGSIGGNVTQQAYLDKAQQNLEKAGYSVTVNGSPAEGGRVLSANISTNGSTIVIAEFLTAEEANSYYNEMLQTSASSLFVCTKIVDECTVVLATGIDIVNIAEGKVDIGSNDQETSDSSSSIVDDDMIDQPEESMGFEYYTSMLEMNLYTEDSISIMSLLDGFSAEYGIAFCGNCNNYLYATKFMDCSGVNYEYASLVYVLSFDDERDAQNLYTAIMNDSNYGPECVHIDPNGYVVVIGNNPTALYEACHVTDKIDPLLDAIYKNDTDLVYAFFIDMKEAILNTSENTNERESTVYAYADAFIINANIYSDEGNRELADIFSSIGEDMYKTVCDEENGQPITEDVLDEIISDAVDRIFSVIENTESNLIMK